MPIDTWLSDWPTGYAVDTHPGLNFAVSDEQPQASWTAADWSAGAIDADLTTEDRALFDAVFSGAYDELRRLAARVRSSDPAATLSPTALVNEAWLKLAATPHVAQTSRLHFKRIAARAMRQVLVEAARRRQSEKRGRGVDVVTFDDDLMPAASASDELLALDDALQELATLSPRQAQLVEARFFGGLDLRETAELLAISESTALRD